MIKHIVMYKLTDPTADNVKALVDTFMSMAGKIPQLKSIIAGSDVLASERSFDVVLECEFDSLEDMAAYKSHEVHVPVVAYVKSVVAKSHSVDYII